MVNPVELTLEGDNRYYFKAIDVKILPEKITLESFVSESPHVSKLPYLTLDISTIANPNRPRYSVCLNFGEGLSIIHESYNEQEARDVYDSCIGALREGGKVKCVPSYMEIFDAGGKSIAKDVKSL